MVKKFLSSMAFYLTYRTNISCINTFRPLVVLLSLLNFKVNVSNNLFSIDLVLNEIKRVTFETMFLNYLR